MVARGQVPAPVVAGQFGLPARLLALWNFAAHDETAARVDLALVQRIRGDLPDSIHHHKYQEDACFFSGRLQRREQDRFLPVGRSRKRSSSIANLQSRGPELVLAVLCRDLCPSDWRDGAVRPARSTTTGHG